MPSILPRPSKSVRSGAIALLVALAPASLLGGCDRQSGETAQPPAAGGATGQSDGSPGPDGRLDASARGTPMPEAILTEPGGGTLRLTDLKGRPVLVNLWATWCAPCVTEMPMLDDLAGRYGDRLRVLTVSQDLQGAEVVEPFFEQKAFTHLEPWLDPENALGFHYRTGLLPTTVLYDAQGREVWRVIGDHDWSSPRTDSMLVETLEAGS